MSRRQDDRDRGDRDRERERDRPARSNATAASTRTNEYFVPKEGIDREVITADICRYLGNDALVRPGVYEDPRTREARNGYFITAYRNLTTAMIEDLKADSQRWAAEREATASRTTPNGTSGRDLRGGHRTSNASLVQEYRASMVHQSRQYYGPTEGVASGAPSYPTPAPNGSPAIASNYDSRTSPYGQPGQTYAANSAAAYPSPVSTAYQSPAPGAGQFQEGHYYASGADYPTERTMPTGRGIPQPNPGMARNPAPVAGYSQSAPAYPNGPEDRYYASTQQLHPSQAQGYGQPPDAYYGRGVPVDYPREVYAAQGYPSDVASSYHSSMIPPGARDPRDGRDVRDVRESREVRETRDARELRDSRDSRDHRRARDEEPSRSSKHSRHHR